MTSTRELIFSLFIFWIMVGILLSAIFMFDTANRTNSIEKNEEIHFSNAIPEIILSVYPEKVRPGDILLVKATINSECSVSDASITIKYEDGSDTIKLVEHSHSLWEASWIVHDTLDKTFYPIIATVTTHCGVTATATTTYYDPTVSHSAEEVEAGTFIGDFVFNGTLTAGSESFIVEKSSGLVQASEIYSDSIVSDDLKAANKLQVNGELTVSGTIEENVLVVDADSGKIGVGTNTPYGRLDITESGLAANNNSGNVNIIHSGETTSNTQLSIQSGREGTASLTLGDNEDGSRGKIEYYNEAGDTGEAIAIKIGDEKARITQDGYLGIGTTNPSKKLEIRDGNYNFGVKISGETNPDGYNSNTAGGRISGYYAEGEVAGIRFNTLDGSTGAEDGSIHLATTNDGTLSTAMTINNKGNVGIGTTSPSNMLHIYKQNPADNPMTLAHTRLDITDEAISADRTYRGLYNLMYNDYDGAVDGDGSQNHPTLYGTYNYLQNKLNNDNAKLRTAIATYNYVRNNGGDDSEIITAAGTYNYAINSNNGHIKSAYGSYNYVANNENGEITNAYPSYNYILNNNAGHLENARTEYNYLRNDKGTIKNARGIYNYIRQYESGTITNAYGTQSYIRRDAGTINNGYLFYGSYSGTIGTKYGVYVSGEDKNYFSNSVGIGTGSPGSYKLYVKGNAYTTGSWGTSDKKFKKNVEKIDHALEKVKDIDGVSYEWKREEYPDYNFADGKHFGVIAQDIENVLPEVVNTDENGEKAVAYSELLPVLIEAVKEQQEIIEQQNEKIDSLTQAVCASSPEAEICS